MKLIRKYWYIVLIVCLIGGGTLIWRRSKQVKYTEYAVSRQDIRSELVASGSLTAEKLADLKFLSGGRMSWVGVKEGDRIKQWQGIASLDRRQLKKTLQKELNDYMNERWNFEDTRDTYLVSTDDLNRYSLSDAARRVLERAQFNLNNTVLEVEIQTIINELATIVAPFDGIVAELNEPNAGVNVSGTEVIAMVVDPATVYFEAEIDETDIGLIEVGQPVEVVLDSYPDEILQAVVGEIGFSAMTLSGGGTGYQVKVRLVINNDDLKYRLGMNGEATLLVAEKPEVPVLPVEAVIGRDGKTYVLQLVDGKETEREVEIGIETDDWVEIVGGMKVGEEVVVRD